ncbi:hypothetical protein CHARACLAT_011490 [Characodon lateralis]|uniref:Uncharacterized protein n=1 Tax=Characodon lateralis TaxID=208331 RepID=A0ABU7D5V5_9TELE|nr:hypothetical protein [Characodon lateralis]
MEHFDENLTSVIFYRLFHSGSQGSWCLSPAVYGREAGYTLDKSPVHRRKLEYPVRIHTCTGRTCKLHAERPQARNQTQDLLATRQQCYQLRHHAAREFNV